MDTPQLSTWALPMRRTPVSHTPKILSQVFVTVLRDSRGDFWGRPIGCPQSRPKFLLLRQSRQCTNQLQAKGVGTPEVQVLREPATGIPDSEHEGLLGRRPHRLDPFSARALTSVHQREEHLPWITPMHTWNTSHSQPTPWHG